MFWTLLLATTLAASFIKLGAASAMVGVLSVVLKCAVLTIAILMFPVLWRATAKK